MLHQLLPQPLNVLEVQIDDAIVLVQGTAANPLLHLHLVQYPGYVLLEMCSGLQLTCQGKALVGESKSNLQVAGSGLNQTLLLQ